METDPTYPYTFEAIQRYLSGSMTASEMHEMEKAALGDPLLADALEGYRSAPPAMTAQHLNEIKGKIAAIRTETKPTPVVHLRTGKAKGWRVWSAAVLIGLIATGGWFFLKSTDQEHKHPIAQNTLPPAIQQTPAAIPEPAKTDHINNTMPVQEQLPSSADRKKAVIKKQPASAAKPAPAPLPAVPEAREPLINKAEAATAATLFKEPAMVDTKDITSLQPLKNPALTTLSVRGAYSYGRNNMLAAGAPQQFFYGKVVDPKGLPIPGASVIASENNTTLSNTDGSFRLPASDSTGSVTVTAVGYHPKVEQVIAGKALGVKLNESQNALSSDVVVIGYGTQKKKSITGALSRATADTLSYKEAPYPQGGWDHFYNNLSTGMRVHTITASKNLHLSFDVKEGIPQNFTVIETPDSATAKKAISIIKKGPRWQVFKKKKKVDVKLKVN